ncbi:MAG TPA: endolytic transglycosylase MltG [Arsenophonus apicola]|uniref:endolytic transglycosylase MltG n=1 Tax=Arsenophonus apicola TaxID=2879119 RepID=UPI003879CC12
MKYARRILWSIIFLLILSGCILYTFYRQIQNYADTAINIDETTIFTLPAGTGRAGLELLLTEQKIINPTDIFQWLLKLEPPLAQSKAGTYRLNPGMSLRSMLKMFSAGKEAQFSLLFIEGSRFEDWKKLLQQAPYLKQTIGNQSTDKLAQDLGLASGQLLEGRFYPDTYYYTAGMSDIDILKRAHQRMLMALEYEWQGRAANLPYKTPYEMLIMASIIEKETGIDTERAKVASVFINRLKKKMRLQTDPTVIYGLGDKYRGVLYRSDLNKSSPYNTYLIAGLPPSPIAMPGRASIKAAAHPDETGYFYFVATGNGGHTFTTNINDHNQAVKHYRQTKDKNE